MADSNPQDALVPKPKLTLRLYAVLAIPILACGFYVIDHVWTASQYNENLFGVYDGTANRTADRMEGVNAGSSTWRLTLCAFGFVGLLLVRRPKLYYSPLLLAIVAYFGWLATTIFWSTEPAATAFKLTVVCVFLVTALGVSRSLTLEQLAYRFAVICGCFLAWGIFAEMVHGTFHLHKGEYRFTGTTHPNTNSVYAAMVCLFSSLYVRSNQRLSWTPIFWFLYGLLFLLIAKSRTSIAATILGMTAIAAIQVRPRFRMPLIIGMLMTLGFASLTFALVGNQIKGKVGSAAAMGRKDDISTLTGRLPLWEELGESIAGKSYHRAWLHGILDGREG